MWSIKQLLRNKNGFTLMELICVICIASIILGLCFSLLTFSVKSNVYGEKIDEYLYHGNFALEYMKNEIQNADIIISADKIEKLNDLYPMNIGFVIMEYQPNALETEKYVFITYYIKDNKLFRLSRRKLTSSYPNKDVLSKSNDICEYAINFGDTNVDWENKILNLSFYLGDDNMADYYKSTIYLHCLIDN